MKKLAKLYLHSSYTVQNSFQFDEIFLQKIPNSNFDVFDVLDARPLAEILGNFKTKIDLSLQPKKTSQS